MALELLEVYRRIAFEMISFCDQIIDYIITPLSLLSSSYSPLHFDLDIDKTDSSLSIRSVVEEGQRVLPNRCVDREKVSWKINIILI